IAYPQPPQTFEPADGPLHHAAHLPQPTAYRSPAMKSDDKLREVKRRHSARLLSQPGVCGVDIERDETGQDVLTVHLDTDDPQVRERLPDQIEGYPVKFVKSGPFRKY